MLKKQLVVPVTIESAAFIEKLLFKNQPKEVFYGIVHSVIGRSSIRVPAIST